MDKWQVYRREAQTQIEFAKKSWVLFKEAEKQKELMKYFSTYNTFSVMLQLSIKYLIQKQIVNVKKYRLVTLFFLVLT